MSTQHGKWLERLVEHMNDIRQRAEANITKHQNKYKEIHDAHSRIRQFKIGDEVLIYVNVKDAKFDLNYEGPYRVVQTIDRGGVNYKVQHCDNPSDERTMHVDHMKAYQRRAPEEEIADGNPTNAIAKFEQLGGRVLRSQVATRAQNINNISISEEGGGLGDLNDSSNFGNFESVEIDSMFNLFE